MVVLGLVAIAEPIFATVAVDIFVGWLFLIVGVASGSWDNLVWTLGLMFGINLLMWGLALVIIGLACRSTAAGI